MPSRRRPEDRRAERGAAAVARAHRHVRPSARSRRLDRGARQLAERARSAGGGRARRIVHAISKRRSTPRGASWRRSTSPGSCSSATGIRPRAIPARRSRTSPRTEFPCRSNRSRLDRSPTPGSMRSTRPPITSGPLDAPVTVRRQPAQRSGRGRAEAQGDGQRPSATGRHRRRRQGLAGRGLVRQGPDRRPARFEVDAPGAYVLEAALIVKGDPLAANNVLMKDTWADPRSEGALRRRRTVERPLSRRRARRRGLRRDDSAGQRRSRDGRRSGAVRRRRVERHPAQGDLGRVDDGADRLGRKTGGGLLVAGGERCSARTATGRRRSSG